MAILTAVPTSLVAGDTYRIRLTFADYTPTAGFTGVLYLRGVQVGKFTATADGDAFLFTLASAVTGNLSAGTYEYSVSMSLGNERTTVDSGFVRMDANYVNAGNRINHVETVLQAITAVIEGRITDDVESLSIAGRSITHIPIGELLEIRVSYLKELAALKGNPNAGRRTVRIRMSGNR